MFILRGIGAVISIVYSVAVYAVCAYSLYTIGSRNGVKNLWLAFVPILQYYIIGSLCEEYEILGVRIKRLEWAMCGLLLLQTFLPYVPYISLVPRLACSLVTLAANILTALIMHKFFYLFNPQNAFIFALLSAFGRLPMAIVLFIMRDKPMIMSAAAYPYPFANRP